MADKTKIEWTEATWNLIRGCSRVSAGCDLCYAQSVANRFSGPGQAYEGLVHIAKNDGRALGWNGNIRFVEEHLLDPIRWKRPRRIFVNSKQHGEWIDALNATSVTFADGGKGIPMNNPYRVKGWSRTTEAFVDCDDDYISEHDFDPLMYRVGKKWAGRLLDGRTYDCFPEVRNA